LPVLDNSAIILLTTIDRWPFVNVADIKKILGSELSIYSLSCLIKNDLIAIEKLSRKAGGFVKGHYLITKGYNALNKEPPQIRGKTSFAHIIAQQMIGRLLEEKGYEITLEKQFPRHFVDVFAHKENESLFFEIVISENISGQIDNFKNDIEAGADKVYFVFAQKQAWDSLESKIKALKIPEEDKKKAHYNFLSSYCIENMKERIKCHTDNSQLS